MVYGANQKRIWEEVSRSIIYANIQVHWFMYLLYLSCSFLTEMWVDDNDLELVAMLDCSKL
jgi:hypothetical protein